MLLKRNLLANYIGQAWVGLMGLAFIPIYIKYLGIEGYALVGLFATFQAWLVLLDMGITPTLSRQMSRFISGHESDVATRNLLRSVEIISICLALFVFLSLALSAGWVSSSWLNTRAINVGVVQQVLLLMAFSLAARLVESVYKSALVGLQAQATLNAINMTFATLRWGGAAAALVWVKAEVQLFFIWQGVVSIAAAVTFGAFTYRVLPHSTYIGRFSMQAIRGVWRFAGGIFGITFLGLLLTQIDKILLSKLLPLSEFGYYTFAATVAGGLYLMIYPITQAYYPRFCELSSRNENISLAKSFHQASQLISVVVGTASLMLIAFSETMVILWTKNPALAASTAMILSVLSIGNLLNGLMWVPYQAQLAYAWTSLATKVNIIAVFFMIPCIIYWVPKYGAIAAAWIWVALNLVYVIIAAPLMFKKILNNEKKSWYLKDIVLPLFSVLLVIATSKLLFRVSSNDFFQYVHLVVTALLALVASVFSSDQLRAHIMLHFKRK